MEFFNYARDAREGVREYAHGNSRDELITSVSAQWHLLHSKTGD